MITFESLICSFTLENSFKLLVKFIYSEKATPFWLALHRPKLRWRFCKILWPSQNIWTLLGCKKCERSQISKYSFQLSNNTISYGFWNFRFKNMEGTFYVQSRQACYLPGPSSSLGVPGVPWHTQILADQLTLFQPGQMDYAHLITTGTPGFLDLLTALVSVLISKLQRSSF